MFKIKNPKNKLLITAAILLFALLNYVFSGSCIYLSLTGIPCPGCGMTRALIAAIKFDFSAAFSYHIMFWSVPILYLCFLSDGKLFGKKWLNVLFFGIILLGFIINWIRAIFF